MANNIHDIYILKSFEKLVYSDMIKLLNELKGLFINYDKIDDEIDKTRPNEFEKKINLEEQLLQENRNIEEVKLEIRNYLYKIPEQEVFDELIKKINEVYITHNERLILKKIEYIINERLKSFDNVNQITQKTQVHAIEILDEWINYNIWEELLSENLTKINSPDRKKDILKQIFQLLGDYNKIEFEQFLENIKRTKDIDFEFGPGDNLYSFANTNWYEDIVSLIQKYKS